MRLIFFRLLLGLPVLLALAWQGAKRSFPPLPGPISLVLTLPAGEAGRAAPLIVTGTNGAGELLYLRYVDATTVVFGYDSWAVGGPESKPVAFTPDVARPLVIEMPGLAAPRQVDRRARGPLRVEYDGHEMLREDVHFRGRAPDQLYFAVNPNGGTIANDPLSGTLATPDGRQFRGRPATLHPTTARLRHWVTHEPLAVCGALAAATAVACLFPFLWRHALAYLRRRPADPTVPGYSRPPHAVFFATAGCCTAIFITVVTGFQFRLFQAEEFGQFYDYQAASLLQGRLDVPEVAVSGEAFIFEGKYYGYFGPTPALLRLPFALAGVGFGRLSRSFLTGHFVVCLAAVYALLVLAARHLSGRASWPARSDVILLVGSAGLGSTLFFVSSRAYIYHEAILCGVAFALWGTWATLRWLAEPARHRWWLLALACGTLAVHARPPAGLFALATLGFAAAAIIVQRGLAAPLFSWRRDAPIPHIPEDASPRSEGAPPPAGWLTPLCVGALAVLAVLSFNGLSYLKFKSFEGAPLKYHVQYHAARLAVIKGGNFHLGNVPYGFDSYTWRPNFTWQPTFPYFFIQGRDPAEYPGTRIDLAENTLGLPYAMPSLVCLAAFAFLFALHRWSAARRPLAVLAAGLAPMAAALCAAIAISQRYTADFVPFLFATAAFGLTAFAALPPLPRRILYACTGLLTVMAIFITFAITLHYQGEGVWGVPDDVKAHYLTLRQTMDHFLGFPSR